MLKEFDLDLLKLVEQAYNAGHLAAAWEDGAHVTNETYYKSEEDLKSAINNFLVKYYDKTTNRTE